MAFGLKRDGQWLRTPDGRIRRFEDRAGADASVLEGETVHVLKGFAAMDRAAVAEIARKGGAAAHEAGTAHEFSSDEARSAGRLGGAATHAARRRAAG